MAAVFFARTATFYSPPVLGIDEHFFSKKKGYVTTFCDLKKHRVFELALGRSEQALETLAKTLDKWSAEIACMWRFTKK